MATTKFLNTKKYNVVRAVVHLLKQDVVDVTKLQDKDYLKGTEFQAALSQAYGEVLASDMKFTSSPLLALVQGVAALRESDGVDQELVSSMDKDYLMGDYACLLKTEMETQKEKEAEAKEQARLAREEKKKLKASRKKLSKRIPEDHFMTYSLAEIKRYMNEKRVLFPKTAKKEELYLYLTGKEVFTPKTHKTLPVKRTDEEPVVEEQQEETPVVEEQQEETPVVEEQQEETPVVEEEKTEEPVVEEQQEEEEPVEEEEEDDGSLDDDEEDEEEKKEEMSLEEELKLAEDCKKVRDLKAYLKEKYNLEYRGTRAKIMVMFEKYLKEQRQ